jgi:hypothetical protein
VSQIGHCTCLSSKNSRKPSSPPSRPMPLYPGPSRGGIGSHRTSAIHGDRAGPDPARHLDGIGSPAPDIGIRRKPTVIGQCYHLVNCLVADHHSHRREEFVYATSDAFDKWVFRVAPR